MVKKFNLKLSSIIKTIVDVYLEIEPLKRANTASGYLRPFVLKEVNRILDYLNSQRETNAHLNKLLNMPENKELQEVLDSNLRF